MSEPVDESAGPPETLSVPPRWLWRQQWLAGLVIAYCVLIVGLWAWMFRNGDRTWVATLFLFGPRWLVGIPWLPLAVAAGIYRRWLLIPLALAMLVIVMPIMGFQINLPNRPESDARLHVLYCNVDERSFRIPELAQLIVQERADIVALVEVRQNTPFIWPHGWHVVEQDQFILASRWPIAKREYGRRPLQRDIGSIRYLVRSPTRDIQVFNMHLSTPRTGIEAVLSRTTLIDPSGGPVLEADCQLRAAETALISHWMEQFPGAKIVMGDFNTPTESTIFRRYWSSLDDAFTTVGWGFGFTKITGEGFWSYGSRIDHIMSAPQWNCLDCRVGPNIGSDHLPLVAEFEWRD